MLGKDYLKQGFIFGIRPNSWVVGWGDVWRQAHPAEDRPSLYAPNFFLDDEEPWWIWQHTKVVDVPTLLPFLKDSVKECWEPQWQQPQPTLFLERVEQLKRTFAEGQLRKAVPVVFETTESIPQEQHRAFMLAKMFQSYPFLIPYGFWRGEQEGMMGLTPERLFSLEKNLLTTMALAGTGSIGGPELMRDPKERHEHQVVIDDLCQQLSDVGQLHIGETTERTFGAIKHLHTPIHMRWSHDTDLEQLVRRLHPTAALGVFPREAGWDWLKRQPEAGVRARFGAPFGLHWPGQFSHFLVAIRNIQWDCEGTALGSGCGIVEPSQGEKEWGELELKRRSVKQGLGIPL